MKRNAALEYFHSTTDNWKLKSAKQLFIKKEAQLTSSVLENTDMITGRI